MYHMDSDHHHTVYSKFPLQGLGFATRSPLLEGSFHLHEFNYTQKGVTSNRGFAAGKVRLENTGAIVMVVNVHLTGNYDCQVKKKQGECSQNLLLKSNLFLTAACNDGTDMSPRWKCPNQAVAMQAND